MICPRPHALGEVITLAHGGGGRATRGLVEHIAAALGAPDAAAHDGAVLAIDGPVALTTDSFVVDPLEFPGGDIGCLAVWGTVNDLVATGARVRALTLSLILEEGLPLALLDRVLASIAATGVPVVTGDTKVVERGRGHGLYVNTAGLGQVTLDLRPENIRPGDVVLVSGDVGRHGAAIMAHRMGFEARLESDCGSCLPVLDALAPFSPRCLRDPTRGGVAAALGELAGAHDIIVERLPVAPAVAAACEVLGLDPAHLPCEGRMLAFVPEAQAAKAEAALQTLDPAACRLGVVVAGSGRVWTRDAYSGDRLLDVPLGSPLPRIC